MAREPCVSFGLSGCKLPKGYGPTKEDRLLGVFFDTDGSWSFEKFGLGGERPLPPLLQAIKKAIEDHLREHPEDAGGHLESKDW